jgi:hypothetical protein
VVRLNGMDSTYNMSKKLVRLSSSHCRQEHLIAELNACNRRYNQSLINMSLGERSPIEYRQAFSIAA